MRHQLREHVVLEARRGRLHPAEAPRGREEPGRQLAEEGVGVGDRRARLGLVPALTTVMGRAASTIFARRSGSTGGWMTSFTGRAPPDGIGGRGTRPAGARRAGRVDVEREPPVGLAQRGLDRLGRSARAKMKPR